MNKVFYFKKRILKFKKPNQLISDEDIVNLFLGVVNLIKKNTELKMEEKYMGLINNLKAKIRNGGSK